MPDAGGHPINGGRTSVGLLLGRLTEAPVVPLISAVCIALVLFDKVNEFWVLTDRADGKLRPSEDGLGCAAFLNVSNAIPSNLLAYFIPIN